MAWLCASDLKYELLGSMGTEGSGTVFRAKESGTNKILAVKIFDKAPPEKGERRHRSFIKKRTQMLIAIRGGPHVPVIGDIRFFDDWSRNMELPMEYYARDLYWLMSMSAKTADAGFRDDFILIPKYYSTVVTQVLEALQFLHSEKINIIHRDIHPLKILFNKLDHFVLAQFDHCTYASPPGPPPRDPCGDLKYMAPEMFDGLGQTTAVDLWSLGILCLEMLRLPPSIHPASTMEGVRKHSWCSKMCDLAKHVNTPELKMMVQLDPDHRPTAKGLLSLLRGSAIPGITRLIPSKRLLYVCVRKIMRAECHDIEESIVQATAAAHIVTIGMFGDETIPHLGSASDNEFWGPSGALPGGSEEGADPSGADVVQQATSQEVAKSPIAAAGLTAASQQEAESSSTPATTSSTKPRKGKKKPSRNTAVGPRETQQAASGPSSESQDAIAGMSRESQNAVAGPSGESQDVESPVCSVSTPPEIKLEETGQPREKAAASSTEPQEAEEPSTFRAISSRIKSEGTGETSRAATISSTELPQAESLSSLAALLPRNRSQEMRRPSSEATELPDAFKEEAECSSSAFPAQRTRSKELPGQLNSMATPLRSKSQEIPGFTTSAAATMRTKSQETPGISSSMGTPLRSKSEDAGRSSDVAKTPPVGLQIISRLAGSSNVNADTNQQAFQPLRPRPHLGSLRAALPKFSESGGPSGENASESRSERGPADAAAKEKLSSELPRKEMPSSASPRREKASIEAAERSSSSSVTTRPRNEGEQSTISRGEKPSGLAARQSQRDEPGLERLPSTAAKEVSPSKATIPRLTGAERTEGLPVMASEDEPSSLVNRHAPADFQNQGESSRAAVEQRSSDRMALSKSSAIQRDVNSPAATTRAESSTMNWQSSTTEIEQKRNASSEGISEKLLRIPAMQRPRSSQSMAGSSASTTISRTASSQGMAGSPTSATTPRPKSSQEIAESSDSNGSLVSSRPQRIARSGRPIATSKLQRCSLEDDEQQSTNQGKTKVPKAGRSAQQQSSVLPAASNTGDNARSTGSTQSTSSSTGTSRTPASCKPLNIGPNPSKPLSIHAPPWDKETNKWVRPEKGQARRAEVRLQQKVTPAAPPLPQQFPLSQQAQNQQFGPRGDFPVLSPPSFPQTRMNLPAQISPQAQFFPQTAIYPQLSPYLQPLGYRPAQAYLQANDYQPAQAYIQAPVNLPFQGYQYVPAGPSPVVSPPWGAGFYHNRDQGFVTSQEGNHGQQLHPQRPTYPAPRNQQGRSQARQPIARPREDQEPRVLQRPRQPARTPAEIRDQKAESQIGCQPPLASAPPSSSLPNAQNQQGKIQATKPPAKNQVRINSIGHGRLPSRPLPAPGSLGQPRDRPPPQLEEAVTAAIALARDKDRFVSPSPSPPPAPKADAPRVKPQADQPASARRQTEPQASKPVTLLTDGQRQRTGEQAGPSQPAVRPIEAQSQPPPSQCGTVPSTPQRREGQHPNPNQGQSQGQGRGRATFAQAATGTRLTERQSQPGASGRASQLGESSAGDRGPSPPRRGAVSVGQQPQQEGRQQQQQGGLQQGQQQQEKRAEEPWQLPKNALKRQRSRAKMGSNKSLASHPSSGV